MPFETSGNKQTKKTDLCTSIKNKKLPCTVNYALNSIAIEQQNSV